MLSVQSDFDKAAELIHAVAKERLGQGHKPGVTWTLEGTLPEKLLERFPFKSEYFTLLLDREAIGAFILTKKKTNSKWNMGIGFMYLAKFCLLDEFRGKGHGDDALELIKIRCTTGLRLEVRRKGQDGLLRLYSRNGFAEKRYTADMHLLEWRRSVTR